MKRLIPLFLFALGTLILAGCGGGNSIFGNDSKPDAPTNVKIVPGDSSVTISWDMQSGIEYWIFSAAAPEISTSTWTTLPQARVVRSAVSPQIIAGLANGTQYSFTVNGRQNSGPGGPGSPSIAITPRLAGQFWSVGTPLPTASLNAVMYLGLTVPGLYTTVGAGGAIFSSSDAVSWTTVASGVTTDLYGITYGFSRYVAIGTGGAMITSIDGATWTTLASGTTSDLRAITVGSAGMVAVGAGGAIVRSADGANWSAVTSGTTKDLYGVSFGVDNNYYAVGAQGTMLSSSDGVTWTAITTGTTADLRSFAYSGITYVAVGSGGTIIYSPDAITWTAITTPVTSATLNSITPGSQFVAVGNGGVIVTSVDGINWLPVSSGVTPNLNAVVYGLTGYSAVGAGGVNISSF